MITRRNFLKLLSSIPAVAALPQTAEVLARLPAEDAPERVALGDVVLPELRGPLEVDGYVVTADRPLAAGRNWLWLDGHAVQARSVTVSSHQDYIDVRHRGGYNSFLPGMQHHDLEAELLCEDGLDFLSDAFYAQRAVRVEALMGNARLTARGYLHQVSVSDLSYGLRTAALRMALTEPWWTWEERA